jgi:hypothetical protein
MQDKSKKVTNQTVCPTLVGRGGSGPLGFKVSKTVIGGKIGNFGQKLIEI